MDTRKKIHLCSILKPFMQHPSPSNYEKGAIIARHADIRADDSNQTQLSEIHFVGLAAQQTGGMILDSYSSRIITILMGGILSCEPTSRQNLGDT